MSVTKRNLDFSHRDFGFEFPTVLSELAPQNDVVFCGRLLVRQTEPSTATQPNRARSTHRRWRSIQLPATTTTRTTTTGYSRLENSRRSRRSGSGLFGTVKFPVQMELSDMRKRQTAQITKITTTITTATTTSTTTTAANKEGEKSGWKYQLIRTLRRKGREWLNVLSMSSFDF